jgi:hypothetical protein
MTLSPVYFKTNRVILSRNVKFTNLMYNECDSINKELSNNP